MPASINNANNFDFIKKYTQYYESANVVIKPEINSYNDKYKYKQEC